MWVSWESDVITVISYSPLGDCTVSHIPLYKGSVNGKSTVVYDEVPNPCYNEYIRYISPLLCLRGQELQHPDLIGELGLARSGLATGTDES